MAKISRNAPCPCGSGKKYKKCCLHRQEAEAAERRKQVAEEYEALYEEVEELDRLSNSVPELIRDGRLEEAETACRQLLERYPDQVDGLERTAELHEARGEDEKAIEYYLKAAEFMKCHPGFDPEAIDLALQQVERLKKNKHPR